MLNATRRPGAPPFAQDDLEYLTRFAGQLSIAVANSMAFAAERERSEQLALVNAAPARDQRAPSPASASWRRRCGRIHEAFQYPVVAISVPDPEAGTLPHRGRGHARRAARDERRASPLDAGITGRGLPREAHACTSPTWPRTPTTSALVPSTRSEVAVPILSGRRGGGGAQRGAATRRAGFDRGQVITLETLADGIGIMLRNAELYQALERTNAKLVELDRMKSELVNIVAHDFRAPLAGVLGHAELLEWRPDAPRADRIEQARSIIHAATHMANLVDKTLKTTRLETGQFPFEFGVVDLAAVAREVVAPHARATRRIRWSLEMPRGPAFPAGPTATAWPRCSTTSISNAVKYSPDGRRRPRSRCGRDGERGGRARDATRGIGIDARRPGPAVPARSRACATCAPPTSRAPASASTSATASCARTAAGWRSRAGARGGIGLLVRLAALRGGGPDAAAVVLVAGGGRAHAPRGAAGGRRAGVRHPRGHRRRGGGGGGAAPRARGGGPRPRAARAAARRRWPSGCGRTPPPQAVPCSRWPGRRSWAIGPALFAGFLPKPLDREPVRGAPWRRSGPAEPP